MTRVAPIIGSGQRLHQFESEWLSGSPPNLVAFLGDTSSDKPRYIGELIEIDLEYRWRGFSDLSDSAALDDRGFPRFPRLEDYAKLLPEALREQVLTPNLVAEEYRVRRRWGDRPDRQSYGLRFPDGQAELETALNCIDAEFATEEVDLAGAPRSRSLAHQSTITHGFSDSEPSFEGTEDPATPRHLGKYVLETLIGRGGFGEVWKARDATLNRYVAVKTPRQDKHFTAVELLNFRSEAQKLAMLGRVPGIVTVYECGEHDGRPYIVSDFIEGESLQTRLDHGLLSFRETAEVVADVAETLNRMHLQGLVHRDIKPQNILLDSAGRPFVADFGMCVTEEEQLSEGHATIGTFAFMSPEQARGESQRTDGRADIYSLGVVLYRMLTGRLPFVGSQSSAYIDQVLHREPRPPRSINPDIPVELERITLKCLRKVVADRYTTAHDLAEDLRSFCGSAAGPAPQIESGRPLVEWMPGRRRTVAATVASIAALVGGGLLIGKLWPAPGPGAGGETALPATVPVPEAPPDDPVPVTIETEPPGARLVVHPVNYATGRVEPEKRTVVDGVTPAEFDLKPGDYLVVAYFDDGRFHEVYRHVPAPTETGLKLGFNHFFSRVENGRNLLPKIEIPDVDVTVGMSAVPGKPAFVLPPHYETEQLRKFSVPDFYVAQYEYTQGQRRNMLSEAHERNRDSHLVDGENFPLRSKYTFDKFVQIAEIEGKRLLTDLEFYYVATNGGATRFPSGNTIKAEAGTGITPVGVPDWDHTGHAMPVFGLCSGVAEWVDTQPLFHVPEHTTEIMPVHRNYYVIKGGNEQTLLGIFDISEADRNPRTQIIRDRGTMSPGLGCRFARSAGPRLKPEDFVTEWKE